jgi:hypothetical protein
MTFVRAGWLAIGAVTAIGCGSVNGVMSGTGGGGGEASTTSATSTTSTTVGTGGTGSSTTTTTTTTTSGVGGGLEPSGYACSGKQPTLAADVLPIAQTNCAVAAACHQVDGTANGFWHYYVNLPCEECTDVRELIAPGDPEHSYVIDKITGTNLCGGFGSMPKDSQLMEKSEIQTIYDWICAGAKDD